MVATMILAVSLACVAETTDAVLDQRAKVDRFAFGGVGRAGMISQGEKDYKLILSRPSALSDFEKLLPVGNPQAQSYALVGIRTLNRTRFRELSQPFRTSKVKVSTQRGCILSQESLSRIVRRIELGEYSR